MFPLALLNPGERGEIVKIRNGSGLHHEDKEKCGCRIEDMGLRIGKSIEMLTNAGSGPILLKVDESRLAIGRGMAMKIFVEKG